ncbi:MAG: NAD-binding protein [Christensenellales bacterium]
MQAKSARKKVRSLRIIIVGCGKVGHTLTEQLVREGHDITIVDTSERVVRDTTEMFDVMGIRGNGASLNVLMEAGLQEADLVIAVTGSDELNLLCCTSPKRPAASWRPSRACAIRITARSCRICVSSSDYL